MADPVVTGRCYCGASRLSADAAALTVAWCHCCDCRRWTGAPQPAFAAFAPETLHLAPDTLRPFEAVAGVARWTCPTCGSPLAARFDYLPGQVWVPLGVLDQAETLVPASHSHADAALPWLHLDDGLPRSGGSGRDRLNAELDPDG
ncbi:GFA family protein [Jannaschia sp. KMU-145]|uniref:GFA family protein n=1 Tax=Jannaschia halovivens TaxID=3388667 RepID=UPI00396AFEFE